MDKIPTIKRIPQLRERVPIHESSVLSFPGDEKLVHIIKGSMGLHLLQSLNRLIR